MKKTYIYKDKEIVAFSKKEAIHQIVGDTKELSQLAKKIASKFKLNYSPFNEGLVDIRSQIVPCELFGENKLGNINLDFQFCVKIRYSVLSYYRVFISIMNSEGDYLIEANTREFNIDDENSLIDFVGKYVDKFNKIKDYNNEINRIVTSW